MAGRLSRRKMAEFVAEKLLAGDKVSVALHKVAAYLIDSGRTRETELIVREIEDVLAERGVVVADVTTAYPLSDALRSQVKSMMGASSLQLRETVDASVLGGVKIAIPGKQFDGTIRRTLTALRAKQL
jgi:F0F1-type ATP synthase delta subunit